MRRRLPRRGNLTALPGDRAVTLTWDNSDAHAVTGYEIRYGVGEAPAEWTVIPVRPESGAGMTTQPVTGLTNGTEYTFEVRAKAGIVHGDSARAMATPRPAATPPTPPPPSPPDKPEIRRSYVGDGYVTVRWDDPNDATIDGYKLRYNQRGMVLPDWSDEHRIGGSGASTTSHTVRDLINGTIYTFEVRAFNEVDDGPPAGVDARPCVITIDPISDMTLTLNVAMPSFQVPTRGCSAHFYRLSDQPSWMNISPGGRITGTPNAVGEHTVTVSVAGANNHFVSRPFNVRVVSPPPPDTCPDINIEEIDDVTVTVGDNISITPRVPGGCGSIEWSMTGAPGVVEIDRNTGVIGGSVGNDVRGYNVRVTATDMANRNNTDYEDFRITVDPPPCDQIVIDPISNVTVTVGDDISITPSVQVNCQITYTMSGRLPPGVRFNSATGVISGTVGGSPDTYDVTVTATAEDNSGNTDYEDFTITVECPDITVTQSPDPVEVKAGGTATVTVSAEGGCGTKTFGESRRAGLGEKNGEQPIHR